MTAKEKLKFQIDGIDECHITTLERILDALKSKPDQTQYRDTHNQKTANPLKDSIIKETDLLSPIDEKWEAMH